MAIQKNELLIAFISIVFIGFLIFSESAAGIVLGVNAPNTEPNERSSVSFNVFVDLESDEIVPIDYLVLRIGSELCTFMVNGTKISGSLCDDISITKNHDYKSYYGYMHGYDHENNINNYFGYGYGYGYEPGISEGAYPYGELSYNITWNTPGVSSDTGFMVSLKAVAGDKEYAKEFPNLFRVKDTDLGSSLPRIAGEGSTGSTYEDDSAYQVWLFDLIKPGSPIAAIFNDLSLGIRRIVIYSEESMKHVKLIVKKLDKNPGIIIPGIYEGNIFDFYKISLSHENGIKKAIIRFSVDKSWLIKNNIDKEDIVLLRFANGRWVELETKLAGNYLDAYEYEAVTPGFSYFASAAKKSYDEKIIKMPDDSFMVDKGLNKATGMAVKTSKKASPALTALLGLEMIAVLFLIILIFSLIGKALNK